jgi:hypothetical protein
LEYDPAVCHCGRPLHYSDPGIRNYVMRVIALKGPHMIISDGRGRRWRVPRHYLALHGVKERELSELGFDEILENPSL